MRGACLINPPLSVPPAHTPQLLSAPPAPASGVEEFSLLLSHPLPLPPRPLPSGLTEWRCSLTLLVYKNSSTARKASAGTVLSTTGPGTPGPGSGPRSRWKKLHLQASKHRWANTSCRSRPTTKRTSLWERGAESQGRRGQSLGCNSRFLLPYLSCKR